MKRLASQTFSQWLTTLALTLTIFAQATAASGAPPSGHELSILHQEDFDGDLSQWAVEQQPGGTVAIIDGKLEIEDAAGCTVWFRPKLDGPIMIEYVATMIDEGGPNDRVSDLNCFWMAIDPENPDDILADTGRNGLFSNYDSLRLYYVGLGGHNNTKTRFRRYVGDGSRPLLPEHDLSGSQYMNTANTPALIQIVADGSTIQYYRDGELIFDFEDSEPYTEGWFGLRTVNNHMTVDNFRVYRIASEEQEHPFLLFSEEDYPEFRARATEEPWASWKAEAMQFAAADWSDSDRLKTRGREDSEVISCNALLYILDPDNAATYRDKIVEGIGVVSSYPNNGSNNTWMYSVPAGSAGFVALVALDVIWDDLDPVERDNLLDGLAARIDTIYDDAWQLNATAAKATLALMQGDQAEYERQRDLHFERIHDSLTEDGGFGEGSTYGLGRLAAASWERYSKAFFIDVVHHQGDYNVYGDWQLQQYYKWALTHSLSPSKHVSTFGDTYFASTPINDKHSASLHRLHRFGDEVGGLASWVLGDVRSRANLFSYVLTEKVPDPVKPTSLIFIKAGAAFIDPNLPEGETNFAALWSTTQTNWHTHKDINALYLEAFGTPILANTGYANANSGWKGYSWNYINHQAFGNNVVLINGADHAGKLGAGLPQGFTSDCLDFAQGDSGNAINGGTHFRNLMLMHADPSLGVGGYFITMDEVTAGSPSLLFHPVTTTHSEIVAGTHYRFPIMFRSHERTDFNLDIFFGLTPASVTFQLGAMTSYSDDLAMETEYIRANYPSSSPPVTTILYPHDSVHPLAAMARLSQGNYQGATVSHSSDVIDYVLSSPGDQEITLAGNTLQGKGVVIRENTGSPEFALLIDATNFRDENGPGFDSTEPVSVLLKDGAGKVSATEPASVTFYRNGIQSVFLNGQQVASEGSEEGEVTIRIPTGAHEFELTSTPPPSPPSEESAVYLPAIGDAYVRDGSYANNNYSSGSLQLKGADFPGYTRKALVQFDLSQLPRMPGWATLRFNLKTAAQEAPNTPVRISVIGSDWSESQVTFNNAPSAIAGVADINLPEEGESFSVTVPAQLLREAWENQSPISFQLEALEVFGGNGIVLHSRETDEQWLRPSLVVTQTGDARLVGGTAPAQSASASVSHNFNTAERLIDGDLGTVWISDEDGASATIDFGDVVSALALDVVFAHGHGQTSYFDLEVSNDGLNFIPLLTGASSSAPAGSVHRVDVVGSSFRYLRITGRGNNVDDWNRIAEILVRTNARFDDDTDNLPDAWEMRQFGNLSANSSMRMGNQSMSVGDVYEFGQQAANSMLYDFLSNNLAISFYLEPAVGEGYEGLSRFYSIEMSESLLGNDWRALPGLERIPATAEWIEVQGILDELLNNSERRGFARVRAWLE